MSITICRGCGSQKEGLLCSSCGATDTNATFPTGSISSSSVTSMTVPSIHTTTSLNLRPTTIIRGDISIEYNEGYVDFSYADIIIALREKYPERFL